ncbi:hypothetical protein [Actinoplanes sp. NPDC026623]|uniref:nSTAND1 domain-containing NTPase n=1 Tax=Actinoplanes sp. NPDC026623 TaxID=3155610 RepID=UPI0033F0AD90
MRSRNPGVIAAGTPMESRRPARPPRPDPSLRARQVPGVGGPERGHATPSPYPGLAMFHPEDAELFFGRAALVEELVQRLGQWRFPAVFGPLGAGRSWSGPAGARHARAGRGVDARHASDARSTPWERPVKLCAGLENGLRRR